MKSDDTRLIDATLAGNNEAFGELVERYQDRLFGTLVHMLGSMHDARDVAQDAFLSAFEKLSTFRREASFYSWLFRIAYNAAVTSRRKTQRHSGSLDQKIENTGDEPVDASRQTDPGHQLDTDENIQQVRTALDQLTEEYRDVIVLKEIEGMRYEEIAAVLNCPIGTVRSRIHRARIELREKLERIFEPEAEAS